MIGAALANTEAVHHAEAAAGSDMPPEFIHLRDAVVVEGHCHVKVNLWRGRLESVDAWFPGGRLTEVPYP
jgi:hypothetical protein